MEFASGLHKMEQQLLHVDSRLVMISKMVHLTQFVHLVYLHALVMVPNVFHSALVHHIRLKHHVIQVVQMVHVSGNQQLQEQQPQDHAV